MSIRSLSFDDDDPEDLNTFSGSDLLLAHYDQVDLAWEEVAERSLIDKRRGLVIAQTTVLEPLIDEYLLYLADPADDTVEQEMLDKLMLGARIARLERELEHRQLLTDEASALLTGLRVIARRRNALAHGVLECRPTRVIPVAELGDAELELEWLLVDRRGKATRVSMAELRADVGRAIGCFMDLLRYAEQFVDSAPPPQRWTGGRYLTPPR